MPEQEELDQTDEQLEVEADAEPGSKPKQKRYKLRNPLAQLQKCAYELSDIAADKSTKPNGRVDALVRKADILTELARLTAKDAAETVFAENEALKQKSANDTERIATLEAEVSQWKQKASERLVQTIPDPEAATIRAANVDKDDLIQNAGQVVKQVVSEPDRLKVAALLVKRSGRLSQPFVSEIADFASVYTASQRSDDELQDVISQAAPGAYGSNILLSKAVLAARGVAVTGPRSSKPVYKDIFDELDGVTR